MNLAHATLYDRLGGTAAVRAAVDVFYERVLSDDHVNQYFAHVSMPRLKAMQVSSLCCAEDMGNIGVKHV